jgi:hypothetical protein
MTERPKARVLSQVAKALTFFTIIVALAGSQLGAEGSSHADAKKAIQSVLDQQVAAWNRGDIKGFMSGYWNSEELTYIGNTKVTRGGTRCSTVTRSYRRPLVVKSERWSSKKLRLPFSAKRVP